MSLSSYPYPVLMPNIEGDVNNSVISTVEPEAKETLSITDTEYQFLTQFIFDDEYIKNLINDEKAAYCAVVKCPNTSLSKSFISYSEQINFEINRADVRGKVDIEYYVILLDCMTYKNPNMHEDYTGLNIELTPGDILVDFGETTFNADIQFNKYASAEGIFTILRSENEPFMIVDTNNSKKIKITLPSVFYDLYIANREQYTHFFDTTLAIPVLIQALNAIDFDNVENDHRIWVQSIVETIKLNPQCKDIEITNNDKSRIPELAQALFQDPYKRFVDEFNRNKE